MHPDPSRPPDLRFELHVALTLQPDGLQPVWQADLLGEAFEPAIHFDSLPALIGYLARLDRHGPPSRGLR